jgi:magnesium chelatase subunit I
MKRRVRVVELPVGATEDRVVGTLDLEHALKKGEKRVEPAFWPPPTGAFSMWTR